MIKHYRTVKMKLLQKSNRN